jgi:hypothetical protein
VDLNKANYTLNSFFDGRIGIEELKNQANRYQFTHLEVFQEIKVRAELQPHPQTIKKFSQADFDLDRDVLERVKTFSSSRISIERMAGIGFSNIGNSCFINASLQGFLARKDISAILKRPLDRHLPETNEELAFRKCVTSARENFDSDQSYQTAISKIVRKNGETEEEFQQRLNLKKDLNVLYDQLISERPNQRLIDEAVKRIAYSPLFIGKISIGKQEDAEEFLRLLMNALEMYGNNDSTSLQFFGERHFEPAVPIISLSTTSSGDVSIQKLLNRSSKLKHNNLANFTGISFQLPRTTINYTALKTFRKISGLLQPVVCNIYDEAQARYEMVKLVPDAIVCHHGGRYSNNGHYVTIVRKEDSEGHPYYVEKNDSYVRVITEEQANQMIETSAALVHYSVSRATESGMTGISSQG